MKGRQTPRERDLTNIAAALLGLIADVVDDRLEQRGVSSLEYDSEHLPPRTTRRRFAEVCLSGIVAGACKEGRVWTCSRAAWHAARGGPATGPKQHLVTNYDVEELADRALGVASGRGRQ